jgi:glucose-6-phosphate 1-dehydrogenase
MSKKDVIITIFGATGDLSARKLLPALQNLLKENAISENTLILALGRKDYDTETYLNQMANIIDGKLEVNFLKQFVQYVTLEITKEQEYGPLKQIIKKHEHSTTKKLFYLAISPHLLPEVAKNIHTSGLVNKANQNERIVFEKPFGENLKTAKKINKMLWQYFTEQQIYRIDHYLGKESIQNIMTMRFANRIFEAVWNKRHIKNITIFAKEKDGILNRGNYYDNSGAIRDMLQSHLLQVLALLTMKAPKTYYSSDVKKQKVKALKKLSFAKDEVVLGQYEGYLNEPNVKAHSTTETYVKLKAFLKTKQFKKVPFILITGKKLNKKEAGIIIEFKETKEQKKWNLPLKTNKLFIEIAPNDGIKVQFNAKVPALREQIKPVQLEYASKTHAVGNIPEAYEKLLLDALEGAKTLFTRWDEIEALWKFTDKVKKQKNKPIVYKNETELSY